jgi:hypothetical protein
VITCGLPGPIGVAIGPDDTCLVSEREAGRVVELTGSRTPTPLADLPRPQGILVIAVDMADRTRPTIASGLPVGAPPGVVPKPLQGMPPFSGAPRPVRRHRSRRDGTICVSADPHGRWPSPPDDHQHASHGASPSLDDDATGPWLMGPRCRIL